MRKMNKNILYEKYYKEYKNLVGYVISLYVNKKEDIEDLIDEVFIEFFNNYKNIKINKKSYLTTISKNKAINFLKKNNLSEKNYQLDENSYFVPIETTNTEYYKLEDIMKKILDDLSIDIILKHINDDLSFKEIAKILNLKEATIKTKYYRGLKEINKYYKEHDLL